LMDKNQTIICVDKVALKDKKQFKKWVTAKAEFAVRKY
jgi:hypothetical protein